MLRKWLAFLGCAFALGVAPFASDRIVAQDVERPILQKPTSEAKGVCVIGDQKIDYTVVTGRLPVKDMTGKAEGKIFFVAYVRTIEGKPASRPLTFCFNGGPGASSSYLHMGAFGPRRVALADDGKTCPAPPRLVDNDCTLLDVTDLVFVDPISTGFSRADHPKDAKLFYGLDPDARSVGEFIRSFVATFKREESPTFIAGESYGTTRAAALAQYLQSRGGVKLAGVMLISTVLDYSTISYGGSSDLPYVYALPTYTAAALHHKKVDGDPATLIADAEAFANGPYAAALRAGKGLADDKRREIAKSVAKYTGLSEEYVLKANLRIGPGSFRGELLRESKEVLGRFDARIKGQGGDPSQAVTSAPFAGCLRSYLADELKSESELKYNMMAQVQPWGLSSSKGRTSVLPRLRSAMEKDESFRVFVACGTCDLATPFSAAKHTMAQLDTPSMQERIKIACYDAGHMMYTVRECHKALREDLVRFINKDGRKRFSVQESPTPDGISVAAVFSTR